MLAQGGREGSHLGLDVNVGFWFQNARGFEFGHLQILQLSIVKDDAGGGLFGNASHPDREQDRETSLEEEMPLSHGFGGPSHPHSPRRRLMELFCTCFRNKTCCPPQPAFCFVLQYDKPSSGLRRDLFIAKETQGKFAGIGSIQALCSGCKWVYPWPWASQGGDGVRGKKRVHRWILLRFAR